MFYCDLVYGNGVIFLIPVIGWRPPFLYTHTHAHAHARTYTHAVPVCPAAAQGCVEVRAVLPCTSQPFHCSSVVFIQKGIHPRRHQIVEICRFWWVMESEGKNVILLSDLNLSSASSPCMWFCLLCWIKELFKVFLPSWRYFYPPWSKHLSILFVVS